MNAWRTSVGSTVVGCALCAGIVTPMVMTSTVSPSMTLMSTVTDDIDGLVSSGAITQADPRDPADDPVDDWFINDRAVPTGTMLIVTPGTDDLMLYPRIKGLRGQRDTYVVVYPESLGPIISGKSGAPTSLLAPGYDASRDVAVANNLAVMAAMLDSDVPMVVYTGFSQGAEGLGNAAEAASSAGTIDAEKSRIVLVSDPRSPWGLKSWMAQRPGVGVIAGAFGAESNGARDPGLTGQLPVVSVIVVGDPVSNFQWDPMRPMSSALVDLAGFATIHAGRGEQSYATINRMGEPEVLHSADGNTTYLVYRTEHHPLTMLAQMVWAGAGMTVSDDQLDQWDAAATAYYPLQAPSAAGADARAPITTAPLTPAPASVTVSAAAATSRSASTPEATPTFAPGRHRLAEAPGPESLTPASPTPTGPGPAASDPPAESTATGPVGGSDSGVVTTPSGPATAATSTPTAGGKHRQPEAAADTSPSSTPSGGGAGVTATSAGTPGSDAGRDGSTASTTSTGSTGTSSAG